MNSRYVVTSENVAWISEWLKTRGGIAIWESLDLSDPGRTVTTPRLQANGEPVTKPGWKYSDAPVRIITDPAEVWVSVDEEVKRFHVAGFTLKVTDGGSRRIRREVEKAGEGAYHVFDYNTQEAVILRPVSQARLDELLMVN